MLFYMYIIHLKFDSKIGKLAKIGKVDIRQAFRLFIINPADIYLMGKHVGINFT